MESQLTRLLEAAGVDAPQYCKAVEHLNRLQSEYDCLQSNTKNEREVVQRLTANLKRAQVNLEQTLRSEAMQQVAAGSYDRARGDVAQLESELTVATQRLEIMSDDEHRLQLARKLKDHETRVNQEWKIAWRAIQEATFKQFEQDCLPQLMLAFIAENYGRSGNPFDFVDSNRSQLSKLLGAETDRLNIDDIDWPLPSSPAVCTIDQADKSLLNTPSTMRRSDQGQRLIEAGVNNEAWV